jgi:uncharacterized protein (DUF58 family)
VRNPRAAPGRLPLPRPALAAALLVPAALFAAALAFPAASLAAILADAVILIVALADLIAALGFGRPGISFPSELSGAIGKTFRIDAKARNPGGRPLRLRARLDMEDGLSERVDEASAVLPPRSGAAIAFSFRPLRRGTVVFSQARLRVASPLGLFWIQSEATVSCSCSALPDLAPLRRRLRAGRGLAAMASGLHASARRHGESELDYLREYRPDDDSRSIDWKASLRVGKTVAKVMRSESSRHLVVALDCGRRLMAEQGGVSSLDHAAGALMSLARAAFEMGDSLSAIAFADTIISELPSASRIQSLRKVAGFLSGLESRQTEANFEALFERLSLSLRKRSLVILITDLSDGAYVDLFRKNFALLGRRHLPLLILLKDTVVRRLADEPREKGEAIEREYARVAAREMERERGRALGLLRASGISVMDLLPSELSAGMTERYLDLKTRGAL